MIANKRCAMHTLPMNVTLTSTMEGKQMKDKGIDMKRYIRDIPDWPKEGILFRDITYCALILQMQVSNMSLPWRPEVLYLDLR